MAESFYQEVSVATGLPGTLGQSRLVGSVSGTYPTTGTFTVGDYVIDQIGAIYVCTVAGSPGTWVNVTISLGQDITLLDNLQYSFDGISTYYTPTYQGSKVVINNPFRLQVLINGIKQKITSGPETVWLSDYPIDGMWVDANGNLAFSEVPPVGSSFDGSINLGPSTTSNTTIYPFAATDLLLGV